MRPSVVGLELGIAQKRLQSVGVSVLVAECSSKKGVPDADEARVVRQRDYDGHTELLYARFKTTPDGEGK